MKMKSHLKKNTQENSQRDSRVNKFSDLSQNTQKTPRKKSLFNEHQTTEKNEKQASEKTILKQHPSSLMFRNGDLDNYVVKSNNTSLSNIINNGTQSFLEEYKGSRLGDSLLKIKTSSQNQNTSFSKSTQQYRKSLLYGHSSNEEEKNSDYSLRSSVVMTFNPTGGISNKNSKNDLPNYSNIGKFIFKQRSDRLLNLNNDPQLNTDYYSQNRESFKASITSLPANNDNTVPVNLELSQSQILPITNREGSQVANTVASTANLLNNQVSCSNILNAGLSNRKNSDVVLSLNSNQANSKKPNFKRFTINYAVKEQEKHKIEVVSNVGEYCYLKQYKEVDQDIVRFEDEEIDCDVGEEEVSGVLK